MESSISIQCSKYDVSFDHDEQNNCIISNANYTIVFNIINNKCKSKNDTFEDQFFCNVINNFNFKNIQEIILSSFDIFCNLQDYCICCFQKNPFKTKLFTHCGSDKCKYKLEEHLVDNYVSEFIIADRHTVELLLLISQDAINAPNAIDLFDPFPTHFLSSTIESLYYKRGQVAKVTMTQIEYDKFKSIKRIVDVKNILNSKLNTFLDYAVEISNDKLLMEFCGKDVYYLLRFILKSSNITINPYKKNDNTTIYSIKNTLEIEKKIQEQFKIHGSSLLFHGSPISCWHSIIRNGLKVMSGTLLQTTGAAYGSGIYMSDDFNMSYGYCKSTKKFIMGVYEVIGDKKTYNKGGSIFVIPYNDLCILRYLIISDGLISTQQSHFAKSLNSLIGIDIQSEKKEFKSKMNVKQKFRLNKEIQSVREDYIVDENGDDWIVNLEKAKLHIVFPETYPFTPPFIYIKEPFFTDASEYISKDGALCIEYLSSDSWMPSLSIKILIFQIDTMIVQPGTVLKDGMYDLEKAKESYDKMSVINQWSN